MSIIRSREPLLSSTDRSFFLEYIPVLLYRPVSNSSREMEAAEWFWVPRRFQVLPFPIAGGPVYSSRLQIGFLECLEIPYPEYVLGRADMEAQSAETGLSGSTASAPSTDSFFGSYEPSPAAPDWGMSPCNTPVRSNRFHSFGFVKRRLDSQKDLDFEDAIFIPTFCSENQPRNSHAIAGVRARAGSNSPVRYQPVRPQSPAMAPQVDLRHPRPQHTVVSVSENTIATAMLTNQMTTPEHNRGLCVSLPNRRPHTSNRPQSWRTPPSSHAPLPLTPPSSDLGGSSRIPHCVQTITREVMARQGIDRQSGQGIFRPFVPCRAVQGRSGHRPSSAHSSPPTPGHSARSTNHYGHADLPADQNCAIYVVGIPALAGYADILGSIRGGKIYICLIDPPSRQHPTAAAKIVFFTRASAESFMRRQCTVGVYILGQRVRAMWNRIRYPAYVKAHQSRVLRISGPARWMNFDYFERFLGDRLEFQEESHSETLSSQDGQVVHIWRFASLRAQAELAYIAIEREMRGIFKVEYDPDPCAQPWI